MQEGKLTKPHCTCGYTNQDTFDKTLKARGALRFACEKLVSQIGDCPLGLPEWPGDKCDQCKVEPDYTKMADCWMKYYLEQV